MRSKVHIVIGRGGEVSDPATWVVGAFSTEERARDWAEKAEKRTNHLTDEYGPLWFEMVDGRIQEELKDLIARHQKGEVGDNEYFKIYLGRRRELTATINPWDPDMRMDTEYFTPCSYSVLSLKLDPNIEEQEVSEDQKEDGVEAEGNWEPGEGESPS